MTGGVTSGRGRGAGQISGRGRTAPWQARAGGSRDHQQQHWQQEAGGREWQDVGRRGSTRTRDISLSPPQGVRPPGKKSNNMASPHSTNSNSITISPNKYKMPEVEGEEDLEEEEEGEEDTVVVC
jgi:ribosomal protein L15